MSGTSEDPVTKDDKYPNIRTYLEREHGILTGRGTGALCIVAALAKVSEGELREIVEEGKPISDEIAEAIALITEPKDDQWSDEAAVEKAWMLDPEHALDPVPDLTDAEIHERLLHAQDNGKLNVVAEVSGVKGGVATLHEIVARGPKVQIDPVTRMMLLNIME